MNEESKRKNIEYKNRYNSNNYDRINIVVPKGRKADIEAVAADRGVSVNGLVNDLLRDVCGMDAGAWRQDQPQ